MVIAAEESMQKPALPWTAKSNTVYKCGGRKDRNGCTKKTLRKDELGQLIIVTTLNVLDSDDNLSVIADKIMTVYENKLHDQSVLTLLLQEEQATQKAIENLLNAIQQGIITDSTKNRMEESEDKLQTIRQKVKLIDFIRDRPRVQIQNNFLRKVMWTIKILNAFLVEVVKLAIEFFIISGFIGGICYIIKYIFS